MGRGLQGAWGVSYDHHARPVHGEGGRMPLRALLEPIMRVDQGEGHSGKHARRGGVVQIICGANVDGGRHSSAGAAILVWHGTAGGCCCTHIAWHSREWLLYSYGMAQQGMKCNVAQWIAGMCQMVLSSNHGPVIKGPGILYDHMR